MKQTEKTKEAEIWVDKFINNNKYQPTYKDIAEGLGLSQTAAFARCRTFRNKLKVRKKIFTPENNPINSTFENALRYLKCGGKIKREIVRNETVIILYKKKLVFLYEPVGVRFDYTPTNEDILATDWMCLPK